MFRNNKQNFFQGNSKNSNNKNQYYRNDSSYYDNDQYNYQQKPQRRTPKPKIIEPEVKIPQASSSNTKEIDSVKNNIHFKANHYLFSLLRILINVLIV